MDWLSVTTDCFSLSNAIAETTPLLHLFVRDVRESRSSLISLSAELHALDGVLGLLGDDAASASFPSDLGLQMRPVLTLSSALVADLDATFSSITHHSLSDKKARWAALQRQTDQLRLDLEVYRLVLGLALDFAALTVPSITGKDIGDPDVLFCSHKHNELLRILAETGHLRSRVRNEFYASDAADEALQDYLDVLQKCARAAMTEELRPRSALRLAAKGHNSTGNATTMPAGEAPDSAIDMGDMSCVGNRYDASLSLPHPPPSPSSYASRPPPSPPSGGDVSPNLPMEEIENFLEELRDQLPSLPPTPPPRSAARGLAPVFVDDVAATVINTAPDSTVDFATADLATADWTPTPALTMASPCGSLHEVAASTASSHPASPRIWSPSPSSRRRTLSSEFELASSEPITSIITATATTTADSVTGPDAPDAASNAAPPDTKRRRRSMTVSGLYHFVAKLSRSPSSASAGSFPPSSSATKRLHDRSKSSAANNNGAENGIGSSSASAFLHHVKISPDSPQADIVRRSSRRLSASIARTVSTVTSPWTSHFGGEAGPHTEFEPDAVFGVSLRKSVGIVSTTACTHHSGSRSTSVREFPLCVFNCYTYLANYGGIGTPYIFDADICADGAGAGRVSKLRAVFSSPPNYGADMDPDLGRHGYTAYDAAAIIVTYLAELPYPLVPESVARRWVKLSRQAAASTATSSSSYSKRLDRCIDFWEEALSGMRSGGGGGGGSRGGAARSLLKLLLDLWGDVADAAATNHMMAERLAARLMRPLMHQTADCGHDDRTDLMLGLAFVIRKRSEYSQLLRGGTRKSNAAF